MTEITILDVELVDLDTFQLYPGAEIFEEEFGKYAELRSKFEFRDQEIKNKAIKKLKLLNLGFQQFHRLELDSGEELKNYPAVSISFGSQPDLLFVENEKFHLNIKKHDRFNIRKDFRTNNLIISDKFKQFLESQNVLADYLGIESNVSSYWRLKIKPLINAYIIVNGKKVATSHNKEFSGYYVEGSDGKILLRESSIQEIGEKKLVSANEFEFKNEIFNSVNSIFFATGKLTFELREFLKDSKDSFQIMVPIIE